MTNTPPQTRTDVSPAKLRLPTARSIGRGLSALWWAVFVTLIVVGTFNSIVGQAGPAFLNALPKLLNTVGHQPLSVQILAGISAVVLLALLAWLTLLAWRVKQAVQQEQQAKDRTDRISDAQEGVARAAEPILTVTRETQIEVRQIASRLTADMATKHANVAAPTGLPRPLTLVGRDQERAKLIERLKAGMSTGVFAVEGMGGVGKSALAAEVTAQLSEDRDAFPGGAAWIACEGLEGGEGLAELWSRLARALRLEQIAAIADPEKQCIALAAALHDAKRTLIALDNVEPRLDADTLLATLATPGHTALLLSARHAVAPSKLTKIELGPLPAPDAAELFRQRLRQSHDARPNPADEAEIPALVEAVGGLPLAIEMTAAYAGVQHLPLATVREELAADGLSAAAFRLDPKKAPIARFDRSWRVLTASQRRLFAGLSLLAGASFPRDAALALARASGDDTVGAERADADARDDLAALVAYSLVEPLPGERLRLHPLLREYAERRMSLLPADTSDRLGDAMVAHLLSYAQSHPGLQGLDALEAEAAGLTRALEWAHEHERRHAVIALAHALSRAWDVRGHHSDELRMYEWAAQAARAQNDPEGERWALHQVAATHSQVGRLAEARAGYRRGLELARQLGDVAAERRALHGLAVLDFQQGKLAEARAGFQYALALAKRLGDAAAERIEIHSVAVLDGRQGKLAEARAGYRRALELARRMGDAAAERDTLREQAIMEDNAGNLEEARAGYEAALATALPHGDSLAVAKGQRELGELLIRMGERDRGLELMREAMDTFERLSAPFEVGLCYEYLARLDRRAGDSSSAISNYQEALRRYAPLGIPEAERVRVALRALGAEP